MAASTCPKWQLGAAVLYPDQTGECDLDGFTDYLRLLLQQMSTRNALRELGFSTTSFSSLYKLCGTYGVEIPQRKNQHAQVARGAERGIAVFDLHYPHHTKRLWQNILRFTEDFDPTVFVLGGDNLNIDALDHWALDRGRRRVLEGKRLSGEYEGYRKHIHAPLESVLSSDCRKIWHFGNHEDWVEQYIDQHPEVEGFFEITNNVPLDEWELYSYGKTSNVGKLYFHHGEYVLKHNAAKMVEVFARSVIYGHCHTYQAFTTITPIDSEAHTAVQIPCACDLNPHYRFDKPNAWLNGFCVFYVGEDGTFNVYPVIAIDGKFTAPNGVRYE